jgi:hypothetical protein
LVFAIRLLPTHHQSVVANYNRGNMKNLFLLILVVAACQSENVEREDNLSSEYIVFGHFYGECLGERCVEIYKLTDQSLYEDTRDEYPLASQPYNGDFELLSNALFSKVIDLRNEIPAELSTISTVVIGQPDAGDWGGIYFEIASKGEKRYWLIDTMEANIPEGIRPFIKKIENGIATINQ